MLGILAYAAIVAAALAAAYYGGLLTGALYIPTDEATVEAMLDSAELSPDDRLADLGSGDGRLVIAAALRGIPAVGYEINPVLVQLSRRRARRAGVSDLARFERRSFWKADLSGFSAVAVFGIGHIMGRLERKLEWELRPGSRVIAHLFPLPEWEGEKLGILFRYRY